MDDEWGSREAALAAWLAAPVAGVAVATAPVGAGLTSLARRLLEARGCAAVWVSPTDDKLDTRLRDAGGTRWVFGGSNGMREKVVVLDDFDAASADKRVTGIVTAWLPTARCKVLIMGHPSTRAAAKGFAKTFCMDVDRFDFPASTPDRRSRDVNAAFAARGGVAKDAKDVVFAKGVVFAKDVFADALDSVDAVLDTTAAGGDDDVQALLRAYEADPGVVAAGVFENYAAAAAAAGVGIDAVARAADALSLSDTLAMPPDPDAVARGGHGALAAAAPGMHLRRGAPAKKSKTKRPPPRFDTRDKFGTAWSKEHTAAAKAKNIMGFHADRGARGLPRLPVVDMAYQRALIHFAANFGTEAAVVRACGGLGEKSVLALMRLSVPGGGAGGAGAYKHARVKRVLLASEK